MTHSKLSEILFSALLLAPAALGQSFACDGRQIPPVVIDTEATPADTADVADAAGLRRTSGHVTAPALHMHENGEFLEIAGGQPGQWCALLLGYDELSIQLPGGALLRVAPLVTLMAGRFDADGMLRIPLEQQSEDGTAGITFLAQAITVDADGNFAASSLANVEYDGRRYHVNAHGLTAPKRVPDARRVKPVVLGDD